MTAGRASAQWPGEGDGEGAAESGRVRAELNKVEDIDGACRSFFLFRNHTPVTLTGFEMSLAILDTDGVIDRLLTIDAAPLPAGRTTLKLFDIPDVACADIGKIILHDMGACQGDDGTTRDCFALLDVSSRASIAFGL
ncbi:hypothetical protein F1188_00740 [Roseospira marina]|uniref:Tat pathway signal sequence domain protein n=2 Tax=Roseospira marina TaxID=140057 RepID=A0A5M6IIX9_9PROT|nr:hypothetical protein F1188_00740 [Roseospira marina]